MNSNQSPAVAQIKKQKQRLLDGDPRISLNKILNSNTCQTILSQCPDSRERIYTPLRIVFPFIKQVLGEDKSCKKAVVEVAAEELSCKGKKIGINTGPYCKARQRLPEKVVRELVAETGKSAANCAARGWKVYNRQLKVLDGKTVKAADT